MAIVAVAAHLLKQPIGDEYGLRRLAERHQHDLGSLDQVGEVGCGAGWCGG